MPRKSSHSVYCMIEFERKRPGLSARVFLSLSLLGLSPAVHAQSDDLTKALDEIVVTATGTPHNLKNVPVQTEVISRKQIEQLGASTIEEILAQLGAGFDFNPGDMGAQMTMNGLGNSYLLILVDGKRMHGDQGGENDLGHIDPHNIDHIEIVKGAGSALYGSDAMAGVINVVTKKHDDEGLYLENTTKYGSYNDVRQHNSLGFTIGKLNSMTNYQLQHTDGWQNTGEEDPAQTEFHIYDSKNKTLNEYTNWQLIERLTYTPTDKLSMYADGMAYGKRIYRPTNGKYASCDVNTFDMQYRDAGTSAGATYKLKGSDVLAFDASWNRHAYYYYYTATTLEDGYDPLGNYTPYYPYFADQTNLQSDQRRFLAQAKGVFTLPYQNGLSVGAEYRRDYLNAPMRVKNGEVTDWTAALYLQDEFTAMDWMHVTAGLRMDQNQSFGFKATPKLSVMFPIGEFRLRAGWSQGFKTPTPKELYYKYIRTMGTTTMLYVGNPELKAQTSDYYSTSIEWSHGGFSASVTGYLNKLDNMIALVNIGMDQVPSGLYEYTGDGSMEIVPRQYQNMENAKTYGADATMTWRITKELTIGGSYSYLDTEANVYNSKKHRLDHVTIDGMAHHKSNMNATWNHRFCESYRLGLGLYCKTSSTRYYQNNGNGKPYQIWKLTTAHDLGTGKHGMAYRVEAGIDNILDYYETTPHGLHYGTTSPGRTFYCTLSVKFSKGRKMDTKSIIKESGHGDDD